MTTNWPASSSGLAATPGPPKVPSTPDERTGPDERRRILGGRARERAEVVLVEVVGQQQAVADGRSDDAVLGGGAVEAVVDAADRAAEGAEVAGGLAGVHQLAALVEVVADRDRQVLLTFGHGGVLEQVPAEVGELVLRVLGQPVLTEVPDHGPEVAEHAEVVRHALLGHVPDRRPVACRPQGRDVGRGVLGTGHRCGIGRVDPLVVLVGHHEHLLRVSSASRYVNAATGPFALAGPVAGEPHLDPVTRSGAADHAAELGVVRRRPRCRTARRRATP